LEEKEIKRQKNVVHTTAYIRPNTSPFDTMKVSAALSLCIAPLALAKAVNNVYPAHARRSQHLSNRERGSKVTVNANVGSNSVSGVSAAELAALGLSGVGISQAAVSEVIIIWVNQGGGAATTVVNQPVTTTVTVQAGAGGAAPAGEAAATTSAAAAPPPGEAGTTAAVGTAVTSAVAGSQTHTVTVGGAAAGLAFNPPEISAKIGDMVIFTFLSNNHTATQSAFATPCEPLAGGMDSGFQPNPNNTVNPPPQVAMQVMVDTPLWFFCKQNGHCGKGMTFSINPTADKTQALFQSMAIAQNGTGTGSAITGGGAAAPGGGQAAAPAGSSSSVAAGGEAAATSLTATVGGEATATTAAGGAAATGGVAVGTGQIQADGACSCAVVCNVGPFPAVAQGAGAFGGLPG
jgi:plastocyanin